MNSHIFHKIITGAAATVVAVQTIRIADDIERFLSRSVTAIDLLAQDTNRISDSIVRGMDKYAPTKK